MAGGAALSLIGGLGQASTARATAAVSMNVAQQEMGINNQKQQQMALQAQRSQLENFRNIQRARAQGLNAATNQGAQFGTGLQGGQAQAQDQGNYNSLGISQNLQTGEKIAGYNSAISEDKIQLAQLGGQAATDQGLSSLGGALMTSAGTVGKLGKNAGSISFGGVFGGGSPSGYGTG